MTTVIRPILHADVLERLWDYAFPFRKLFDRSDQFRQAHIYMRGLLLDGERKSIQPLSCRVPGGDEQRLQQFVNQSPWDVAPILKAYRAKLAEACGDPDGVIVIDDTGFAKQGKHSVGVARQYSGTLGKIGNCQVAVSLQYASTKGDFPLALRLYLPESWTTDPVRMARSYVPPAAQAPQTKWAIALGLLDTVRAEGIPHAVVVADAGYGAATDFRAGLEARQEDYVVGVTGEESVWLVAPTCVATTTGAGRGRPPTRAYLAAEAPRPDAIHALAETLPREMVTWRNGVHSKMTCEFSWVRAWPAHRWQNGVPADAIPDTDASARWLLVEWRADGTVKYALSNLPADTPIAQAVRWWKERWQVEQGYRQLKRELGLDHFEGRSWNGFHHHAVMTFLAYGFLTLERLHAETLAAEDPPPDPETDSLGEADRGAQAFPPCVALSSSSSHHPAVSHAGHANAI